MGNEAGASGGVSEAAEICELVEPRLFQLPSVDAVALVHVPGYGMCTQSVERTLSLLSNRGDG